MGVVDDCTTSIALLPTFRSLLGADPNQYLSQFLIVCIANYGRTKDIWLRWLLVTLKDTTFKWYNYQPIG